MNAPRPDPDSTAWAPPAAELARWQNRALVAGLGGAAACLVGFLVAREQFFRSYLVAYLLWLGIALGCLAIAMIHHLSRGAWGVMVRRPLEAAARTLPLLFLLFLPLLAGLPQLYLWARPQAVAADALLQHKALYLNTPFFIARLLFYFLVWGGVAGLLDRWSARQDATGDPRLSRRLQVASAAGLVGYSLTATFAAVDWLMSLDPHWFSSLYGFLTIAGQGLSGLAFLVFVAAWLAGREPMKGALTAGHFHDYGKLLLAFVMFWSYLALSQFIIIWQGNLPEEVVWYQHRFHGGWQWVGTGLLVLHFFFPFLLLLSRGLKRRPEVLARIALLLLAMRWVDLHWQVAPTFHPEQLSLHWLDLAALVAVGGLWLAAFLAALKSRSLLPVHDPHLSEALAHE